MPQQKETIATTIQSLPEPIFGLGGKYISETAVMIIAIATVFALITRFFSSKLKDALDLHNGVHSIADKRIEDCAKAIDHERANRKQVSEHLQTQINDVRDDRTKDVERIVRLETRFEGIMNGIDEIKVSIREIRNVTKKDD